MIDRSTTIECPHLVIDISGHCENCLEFMGRATFGPTEQESEAEYARR